jgi:hypothetical protein
LLVLLMPRNSWIGVVKTEAPLRLFSHSPVELGAKLSGAT